MRGGKGERKGGKQEETEGAGVDHGRQEERETSANLQEIYLKSAFLLGNKSRNNYFFLVTLYFPSSLQ